MFCRSLRQQSEFLRSQEVQVLHSFIWGSDVNMPRGSIRFRRRAALTPGYSIIGPMLENGGGCSKFEPGTMVACLTRRRAQAERMNLPEEFVVPVPEGELLDVSSH